MTKFSSPELEKLYKKLLDIRKGINNSVEAKTRIDRFNQIKACCEKFFSLCTELSTKAIYATNDEKKLFNGLMSVIQNDLTANSSKILSLKFETSARETLQLSTENRRIYEYCRLKHYYKQSRDFLKQYIEIRDNKNQTIENYRELITGHISNKQSLRNVRLTIDGDTMLSHYTNAYALKTRTKNDKETADNHFQQIQIFIDQEAFKHLIIGNSFYQNSIVINNYYDAIPVDSSERSRLRKNEAKEVNELNVGFAILKSNLLYDRTLSKKKKLFTDEYQKFILDIWNEHYTQLLTNSYNNKLHNPFNISNQIWYNILVNFPSGRSLFLTNEGQYEFINNIGLSDDFRGMLESQVLSVEESSFLMNEYINGQPFSTANIPAYDEKLLNDTCPGWNNISEGDFHKFLYDLTFNPKPTPKPTSQKTASEQEKPVITTPPDLSNLVGINVPSQPSTDFDGKPVIADKRNGLEQSLKKQLTDQTSEAAKIQNMLQLPPSEASADQSLSNAILCSSTIKALSVAKGNSFASRAQMIRTLSPNMLPKFAHANTISNQLFKSPVTPTQAIAGYKKSSASSKKTITTSGSTSTNIANGKKAGGSVKGGMAVFVVFVGLETLHARLENKGRSDLAAFVPVPKHFRPWGETFFSTLDENLNINPQAGHSTTRLFTHVADGTAYVFMAIDNTTRAIGKSEEAIYKSMLSKKTTGFEASRFGIITGILEGSTVFIDTVGGDFDKRRAQAQKEFDKQAHTLPPNFVIWENWAKLCLTDKKLLNNQLSPSEKHITRPNIHSRSKGWVSMKPTP